jgi:SAM-dependent methyltransferase
VLSQRRPQFCDEFLGDKNLSIAMRQIAMKSIGPDVRDNWDTHWKAYAGVASENPAQKYRHRTIIRLLKKYVGGQAGQGMRVLDIGSGQGDLAAALHTALPGLECVGFELSQAGVTLSRLKVPDATFLVGDLYRPDEEMSRFELWATHAICSEVLEHLDDPIVFLRNARRYLRHNAVIIVTVPGGTMSAFDCHIGHRRHFGQEDLRDLLTKSGFEVREIFRAGFPFFNLYRLLVIARGAKLAKDVKEGNQRFSSLLARWTMQLFNVLFSWNWLDTPWGWQLIGIAQNISEIPIGVSPRGLYLEKGDPCR